MIHEEHNGNHGAPKTGRVLTHAAAAEMGEKQLLPELLTRYALEGFTPRLLSDGDGPNLVYALEQQGAASKILRISYLPLRTYEDLLAEMEYVRYLKEKGDGVAGVIPSQRGALVEPVARGGQTFYACLFECARGGTLASRGYRYREGVPIRAYWFDCGKTLGRLHRLAKAYRPRHRRRDFFDRYTAGFIREMVPNSLPLLRKKSLDLLARLKKLPRTGENYGMVHFDFSDGNYHVDFGTGEITVFDFDNACTCWYLYDLADLWLNGTGWTGFAPDAAERRVFMDNYFAAALEGYRTETAVSDAALNDLPLFLQTLCLESILDYFEALHVRGECVSECEDWVSYRIRCMEEDIPYLGFFHEIYSPEAPFESEPRRL